MVVEEETKEEITSRDFDLPELGGEGDEFHDSSEGKPLAQESQANFVLIFWQFILNVVFFNFLEGTKRRQITNEPNAEKKDA